MKSLVKNGCTVVGSVGVSGRDDNFEQVLLNFKVSKMCLPEICSKIKVS